MTTHSQQGYVLLSVLAVLLGIGGGLLSFLAIQQQGSIRTAHNVYRELQPLVHARQSLLSYTALYPYFYGPTGAGPAHLPCPDTDSIAAVNGSLLTRRDFRRDGPNPPCANLSLSQGALPRHTVLPGHRYLFHAEPQQGIQYSVSGAFVNNPLNRRINLSRILKSDLTAVATLSVPSLDGAGVYGRVIVTPNAMATSVQPSVAMWVLRHINTQLPLICAGKQTQEQAPLAYADELACRERLAVHSERCPNDSLLLYLVDEPLAQGSECLSASLHQHTLERVPAERHWFVRNQWQLYVKIEFASGCEPGANPGAESAIPCELIRADNVQAHLPKLLNHEPIGTAEETQEPSLLLRWVPVS